jgi:hypothetical protein
MKLKLSAIAILSAVFTYVLFLQSGILYAKQSPSATPSPITSPVTSPITGPITFSGFKLQGKVTYKVIRRWFNSMKKLVPASNVTVVAKDRDTGAKTETKTDGDGNYIFTLPSDKYRVSVQSDNHGWFVPFYHNVNLNKDRDGIDFTGFTWNH